MSSHPGLAARLLRSLTGRNPASRLTSRHIVWAYRVLLDRDPESTSVVAEKRSRLLDTRELRHEFMRSAEFKQKNPTLATAALSGHEPPMAIEDAQDPSVLPGLFRHIQEAWQHLGETEPHWSVMSSEQFTRANIEGSRETFYASGRRAVDALFATLIRNGIDPASLRTCLEYGCGLGRVTRWLAERFDQVWAYDISSAHLESARTYLAGAGVRNVHLCHLTRVEEVAALPGVDVIYSAIVLQHNPPPMIRLIIREFLRALNPGGVAYFQVPTYRAGYQFSLHDYLSREAQGRHIEMHVLPQKHIFDLVAEAGARAVEVLEDNWVGGQGGEISNTFLIQKAQANAGRPG